jgi:hypothetical protein
MSTTNRALDDSNAPNTLKAGILLRNRSMEMEIRQSSAQSFLKSGISRSALPGSDLILDDEEARLALALY